MVYAYDLWLPMPTKDLFDTLMMLASVNAAKDMYEKGLEEMKEFNKEYGDFLSPSEIDMMWVKDKVIDPMRNMINEMYANGIDPLRTPEGRGLLSRFKNSIDASRMALNKLTALYGLKYLEAKAKLEAAGKYDPDLEERYLGYNIANWDSSNGAWTRLSPVEAQSLKSLTTTSYDKRTPHQLTKDEVLAFNMPYDSRAKYLGFTYNDLLDIANSAAVGLRGTVYEGYYKDLAKRRLIATGNANPTDQEIDEQLKKDIANQNIEYLIEPTADYKDWQAMEGLRMQNIRNNILMENAKARQISAAAKTRGSKNGKNPASQFDVNDFLISTAAAKTLAQTSYGARFNQGGQTDVGSNPNMAGILLKGAQSEIADLVYANLNYTPVSGSTRNLASNLGYSSLLFRLPRISDFKDTRRSIFGIRDMGMHERNLEFLQRLSNPMSEHDFALQTKRTKDNLNNDFVMMNRDVDKSRIFSADEVALSASGVNYPNAYIVALNKTKNIRSIFESSFKDGKTMMISDGYYVGLGLHDGAYHLYLRIRIVNKNETGSALMPNRIKDTSYDDMFGRNEVIYYDMGIDTQENPTYSVDGVIGMNRKVTAENLSSDRALLKEYGVSSTTVKSDESIPDIYGQTDDSLDDYDEIIDLLD